MRHDVHLSVNGIAWGGWLSVRIEHGLTQLAQSFELTLTERWKNQNQRREINVGDSCELLVDNKVELIGFIDDVVVDYSAESHTITILGRDLTADIIDSSAPLKTFKNQTLLQIGRDLLSPFGRSIRSTVDVSKPFKSKTVDVGTSVFEFLESLARQRGVILSSDQQANIIVTRAGSVSANTALVLGNNILSCQSLVSHRDRFNQYIVYAQVAGDENLFGDAAAHIKTKVNDNNIRNGRVLRIQTEISEEQLEQRAAVEASVRYGQSRNFVYKVVGWYDSPDGVSGELWRHNQLVSIDDAYNKINSAMLIVNVARIINEEEGITTELSVMPREAFDVIPIPDETLNNAIL